METSTIILAITGFAFVGAIILLVSFLSKRARRCREEMLEVTQKRIDTDNLRKRIAAVRNQCNKEEKVEIPGLEVRDIPEYEAADVEWLFKDSNLRDYWEGECLAETGWFKKYQIAETPAAGDVWGRVSERLTRKRGLN